jgi:hypothetical protein
MHVKYFKRSPQGLREKQGTIADAELCKNIFK